MHFELKYLSFIEQQTSYSQLSQCDLFERKENYRFIMIWSHVIMMWHGQKLRFQKIPVSRQTDSDVDVKTQEIWGKKKNRSSPWIFKFYKTNSLINCRNTQFKLYQTGVRRYRMSIVSISGGNRIQASVQMSHTFSHTIYLIWFRRNLHLRHQFISTHSGKTLSWVIKID